MTFVYSFGDPNNPEDNDPRFDTEDKAINAALLWCKEHDDMLHAYILAVWAESDYAAEMVCLIHTGEVWRP